MTVRVCGAGLEGAEDVKAGEIIQKANFGGEGVSRACGSRESGGERPKRMQDVARAER